jgi:hypothetical protein
MQPVWHLIQVASAVLTMQSCKLGGGDIKLLCRLHPPSISRAFGEECRQLYLTIETLRKEGRGGSERQLGIAKAAKPSKLKANGVIVLSYTYALRTSCHNIKMLAAAWALLPTDQSSWLPVVKSVIATTRSTLPHDCPLNFAY